MARTAVAQQKPRKLYTTVWVAPKAGYHRRVPSRYIKNRTPRRY